MILENILVNSEHRLASIAGNCSVISLQIFSFWKNNDDMNIQKNKIILFDSSGRYFVFFLYRNSEQTEFIQQSELTIDWRYLSAGLLMMVLNYLCATISWQIGMNGLKSAEN